MSNIYDVCVAGSGAGGAVAAYELAKKGLRVIVVEKGKRFPVYKNSMNPLKFVTQNLYSNSMTPVMGNGIITTVLATGWGGTTEINSAIMKNAPDYILDRWFSLELKVGAKYRKDFLDAYEEIEEKLNLNRVKEIRLGKNNEIIKEGLEKLNWESSILPRAVGDCKASGNCLTFCPNNEKLSMSKTYLKWCNELGVEYMDEASVLSFSEVDGIVHVKLKKNGEFLTLKAKKLIITAGIFESPKILKKSKIKNNEIGKNLTMHLGVAVMGKFPYAIDSWNAQTQGWSSSQFLEKGMIIESLSMLPGLVATRLPGVGQVFKSKFNEIRNISVVTIKVSSKTKGRLIFIGDRAIPYFNISKNDLDETLFGIEKCSQVLFAAGAGTVYPGIKGFREELNSAEDLSQLLAYKIKPKDVTFMANHIFGTCSLGKVVDEYGKVINTKNVYVADASIIPSTMANNPQKTIMAFAKLISSKIYEGFHVS